VTQARDPDDKPRLFFHFAVAGVLLGCLAPFVSGALAIAARGDEAARRSRWTARLLALAIFDVLVAAAIIVVVARGLPEKGATSPAPASGPRIGVSLRADRDGAAEVESVVPRGPADRAGIVPGDVIDAVDGTQITERDALVRVISETPQGQNRKLTVTRAGTTRELVVKPDASAHVLRSVTLLDGGPAPLRAWLEAFATPILELLALVGLAIAARIRRAPRWWAPLAIVPVFLGSAAASLAVLAFTARTITFEIVSMAVGAATMAAGGALLSLRRTAEEPRARALPTVLRGLLYAYGVGARFGLVFAAAASLVKLPQRGAADVFAIDPSWGAGTIALFAFTAVVLAPVGEELIFRGALLPWLRTWMSDTAAVLVSAAAFGAGHLYYGAGAITTVVYGVVLAWARIETGRLRAPIAIHTTINGVATAVLIALAAMRMLGIPLAR
jgi:membrane protease YdiL (CAAX protease family)